MPRKVRKQLYLDARHERLLKDQARDRGITEAEIVREALDREERYGAREMRHAVDPEAGAQFLRFIRSLGRRRAKSPAGRTWTRESLYDERVDRWSGS